MTFTRTLIAAVICVGAAVGFASPASAEEFLGVYRFKSTSGDTSKWTITPCADTIGHSAVNSFGPGCVYVGVTNISSSIDPFSGQARLDSGRWNMTVELPDAVRCEIDQRIYPGRLEYSWDAASLSGTVVAVQTANVLSCGEPAMTQTPTSFALAKAS
jgi:hypothetical protein